MGDAWKNIVRGFRTSDETQHIRNLCDFLLEPPGIPAFEWNDAKQVLMYLRDYLTVSHTEYLLARKWSHFDHFRQTAENMNHEIETVAELIQKIEHADNG